MMQLLINNGACIDNQAKETDNITPIRIVVSAGNNECIKLLIENGATIFKGIKEEGFPFCKNYLIEFFTKNEDLMDELSLKIEISFFEKELVEFKNVDDEHREASRKKLEKKLFEAFFPNEVIGEELSYDQKVVLCEELGRVVAFHRKTQNNEGKAIFEILLEKYLFELSHQ